MRGTEGDLGPGRDENGYAFAAVRLMEFDDGKVALLEIYLSVFGLCVQQGADVILVARADIVR